MPSKLIPTHYTYRTDTAVASIHRYGDRGIIYGMLGKDLLKSLLHDLLEGSLKDVGIRTLEGYVLHGVASAIKFISKNYPVTISTSSECHMDGYDSIWITVTVNEEVTC